MPYPKKPVGVGDQKNLKKNKTDKTTGQKFVVHWKVYERDNFGNSADSKKVKNAIQNIKLVNTLASLDFARAFVSRTGNKSKIYIIKKFINGHPMQNHVKRGPVCSCGFGACTLVTNFDAKLIFDTTLNEWRLSQFIHPSEIG